MRTKKAEITTKALQVNTIPHKILFRMCPEYFSDFTKKHIRNADTNRLIWYTISAKGTFNFTKRKRVILWSCGVNYWQL